MTTRLKQKFMTLAMLIIFIIQSLGMVVMPVMRAQAQAGPVQLDVSVGEGESESELTLHSTFRQGQASVEDKALQLSLPSDYYQLQDLHYHDPTRQQWLAIPITTDRSAYQKQWQAYQAYLDDLDAYEEDLANYEQDLAAYQEGVNHLQALKQAQAEAEALAQEAAAAAQAEAQVIDEEAEGEEGLAEEAAEPQVPAPPAPDLPDYSEEIQTLEEHLEEPVAPTDPTDPAKDKLWLIAYQPAADQESYQLHLPDDLQAGQLKWQAQQTKEADQKLQAQLTLDYQINKQAQQVKEKVDLPAVEAPVSESEAEDDTDSSTDEGEEDPQSDEESEEDSKDPAGDHPLPQVDQPLVLHMFERVEAAEVVQNVEDFDPGTTFSWGKAPMTWWPGERTAILQVNHADGTIDQMEIDIQVTTALPRPDNEGEKIDEDTAFRQSQANEAVLQLKKVDVDFQPLAGAGFRLYGISDSNKDYDESQGVEQNKTDFTFSDLKEGQYILDEINTPPGYDRLLDQWQVGVSRNSQGQLEVSVSGKNAIQANEGHVYIMNTQGRLHDVTFKKVDAYSKKPVVGAVFELYRQRPNGDRLPVGERGTTNEQGEFHFRNLPEGTYYLKELVTPRRYIKEENLIGPFAVPNLSGKAYVVEKEPANPPETHFSFYYRDQETKEPLTRGEFQFKDASGQVIATLSPNSIGLVDFQNTFSPGRYTIEQSQPAPGYVQSSEPIHIQVTAGAPTATGTVFLAVEAEGGNNFSREAVGTGHNYYYENSPNVLQVRNLDVQGRSIQGGVFRLMQGRRVVQEARADSNGYIRFNKLAPGEYTIDQRSAPNPYLVEDEQYGPYTVTDAGEVIIPQGENVLYSRPAERGYIVFRKVDSETGEGIPGVRFKPRATGYGGLVSTHTDPVVTSDENGFVKFKIPRILSLYYFREISTAPGYEINTTEYGPWRAPGTNSIPTLEGNAANVIYNDPVTSNLSMTVENQHGHPIQGAVFELTREGDPDFKVQRTSNSQGRVQTGDLRAGKYSVKQVKAPDGYVLNEKETTFTLKLAGTGWRLRLADVQSDLIETDPANPNNYRVINQTHTYGFYKKGLDTGEPLENVYIHLQEKNNKEQPRTKVSASDGFVNMTALTQFRNTRWTVSEGAVAPGYQSTDQTWSLSVDDQGVIRPEIMAGDHFFTKDNLIVGDGDDDKILYNRPLTYDLTFYKKGINEQRIGGAEFTLTELVQNADGSYTPKADGASQTDTTEFIGENQNNATPIIFKNLSPGFYKIQETQTPEGYLESPDPYSIIEIVFDEVNNTLRPELREGSLIARNDQVGLYVPNTIDASYNFIKYGYVEEGTEGAQRIEGLDRPVKPISGAVFELKGVSTDVEDYQQTATSDGEGQVAFSEVAPGRYQLKELSSPADYSHSLAVYEVEVSVDPADGSIQRSYTKVEGAADDDFLVKDDQGNYRVGLAVNEPNVVEVEFQKISSPTSPDPRQPLADAEFSVFLYDETSNSMYGNALATERSDDQGMVRFTDLNPGDYALVENLPPLNYRTPPNLLGRFKVTEDYQVEWNQAESTPQSHWNFEGQIPKVKNDFNPLDLKFYLYDNGSIDTGAVTGFGRAIPNSTFRLIKYEGNPANNAPLSNQYTWTSKTDENGVIEFDFGTYVPDRNVAGDGLVYFQLEQVDVPGNYQKNIEPHIIRLRRDNTFDIYPDHYNSLHSANDLVISDSRYIYINDPVQITLTFNLVDGHTGRSLAGTEFRVYSEAKNADGTPIYDKTYSQSEGNQLYFENLNVGTYHIQQVSAPDGYAKIKAPIQLKVEVDQPNVSLKKSLVSSSDLYAEYVDLNEDGNKNELIIKNYPVATFPDTGGLGPWIFLTVGLIFLVMSYLLYRYGQRLQATERGDP